MRAIKRTFKYKLNPTAKQEVCLYKFLGACRQLYNVCLEHRILAYRTDRSTVSDFEQMKQLIELKEEFQFFKEVHSQVLQDVVRRLGKSFKNFFRRVKRGEAHGFPRFKGRYRYKSFTFPQSGFEIDDSILKMSKIGNVKIVLHREIPENAIIKCLTMKCDDCGDWFACFSTEELIDINKKEIVKVVGVDVGIEKLATLSTGEFFENKKYIKDSEKKLKRLHRRLSRKKRGSSNRKKARLELVKGYRKLKRQRDDYLHKVSCRLVNNFDLMAFEDLRIKNMVINKYLSKHIYDSSWGKLIDYTIYKAEEAGKKVVLVDPRNTSQLCSGCGKMVNKSLSQRLHICPYCSLSVDRDLNASFNILDRGFEKIGLGQAELTPMENGVHLSREGLGQPFGEVGSSLKMCSI